MVGPSGRAVVLRGAGGDVGSGGDGGKDVLVEVVSMIGGGHWD